MLLKYEKMDKFGHVIVTVVQNEVDESESRNSAVDKVGICKCHSFVLIVYGLCCFCYVCPLWLIGVSLVYSNLPLSGWQF